MARSSLHPTVVVYGHGYDQYDREVSVLADLGVDALHAVPAGTPADRDPLRRADALLVREAPVTAALLDALPHCRVVVRYGIGVDNIDLDAASRRRIYVANVPDYGTDEVSTHALALYLAVARRIVSRDRDVRAGAWNVGAREPVRRVRGSVLGLIGFGRIGRAVHRKARALGFARTLVADPYLADPPDDIEPATLREVLQHSHLVSLHAPLTPDTHHLLDDERLGWMRSDAVLVNTARGGLVDEAALVRALDAGRPFGAGLDVFEAEPPARDAALLRHPRVVLSDHTGWYSEEAQADLQRGAAEEVARVLRGTPPAAWVNRWSA